MMTKRSDEVGRDALHYFVDESGDPTLFNRKGRVIIGDEGCSSYFILGKIEIEEPADVLFQYPILPIV